MAISTNDFPEIVREFVPGDVIPSALVLQTTTDTGVTVEGDAVVVNVPFINADDDAGFVEENGTIPEADPDVTSINIATGKVAELGRVSSEQWRNGNVADLLSTSFQRAIIKKANHAFLAQVAPVPPKFIPPAGLLNQGITDGGSVGANLDAVIDAVAGVEEAYGDVTHVLANPTAWATMLKKKRGTGSNESLLGAGTAEAGRALLGKPVLTSPSVPANTLVALDSSSIYRVAGPVRVATSEHSYFAQDGIALRVTFRFGAHVSDPDRVVKLTLSN